MKKSILMFTGFALLSVSSVALSSSWSCSRYIGDDYKGYVNVTTYAKADAIEMAKQKFCDLGKSFDYVKCK